MKKKIWSVLVAGLFAAAPAAAQVEVEVEDRRDFEAQRDLEQQLDVEDLRLGDGGALVTDLGAALFAGGGVTGFTSDDVTDNTQPGGFWNVRGVVGTRSIIGGELAYVGTAQDINAFGLDNATLVSNGLEGALRLQAPLTQNELGGIGGAETPLLVAPYLFGGVGWQRFDVLNEGANTSNIDDVDNVMAVPLGAGIGAGIAGVTLDARFTYRPTFFNEMFGNALSSVSDVAMNQWQLGANLGFEF